jgi:hypothetical protein
LAQLVSRYYRDTARLNAAPMAAAAVWVGWRGGMVEAGTQGDAGACVVPALGWAGSEPRWRSTR